MSELLQPNKEPKDLRPRAAVMAVVATTMILLLVARLYHLQLVRGDELSQKSRENYVKELVEPADRGLILDHRGRLIADNRPSFDVYITPAFVGAKEKDKDKRLKEVLDRLSAHLQLEPEEAQGVLTAVKRSKGLDRFRPYLVKLDVTRDQLDVVEADLANLEGVDVIPSAHRSYRYGEELSHVAGYLSEVSPAELEASKGKETQYRRGDFIGRKGIERSMERELRGKDGRRRIAVDAKGRELDRDTAQQLIPESERRVPSVPGHNVVLALDLGLQHIATQAMAQNGRAGAVVVVDVHTGFVLAMVSYPGYDPNKLTGRISRKDLKALVDDPLEPLFQRAVQQHYHPGSTFKIVTALAGLANGVSTPESATSCSGGYSLGARRWRCHKDSGHGGGINLKRSLQVSCDSYYYWLADKMGLDPISEMGLRMGFGKTTGIELSPEAPGLMPTVAFHNKVDRGYTKGYALNASIGQGAVNVTPLQLALAYAAVGNGGILYKPKLVRRIEDWQGNVMRENQPEVVRELGLKPAYLAAVMQGLDSVVSEPGGTAYSKRLADVHVAGKTGTAQNVVIGAKREKKEAMAWETRDHAWFAALAPAEAPEIAVAVINEHGGHGGSDAAPIGMAAIQGYFDIKRRELEERAPLSPEAIAELVPNPRYASQALASKLKPGGSVLTGSQPQGPLNEPASSPAEVADPSLLRGQHQNAGQPAPVGRRPGDEVAQPSPE